MILTDAAPTALQKIFSGQTESGSKQLTYLIKGVQDYTLHTWPVELWDDMAATLNNYAWLGYDEKNTPCFCNITRCKGT